jgi:hypothetical protein
MDLACSNFRLRFGTMKLFCSESEMTCNINAKKAQKSEEGLEVSMFEGVQESEFAGGREQIDRKREGE